MDLIHLWQSQQTSVIIVLTLAVVIAVSNHFTLTRLGDHPVPIRWPKISVLIPARDEEGNIRSCVLSLLSQDYPFFEVIVLDDLSIDRTPQILQELSAQSDQLKVLRGKPLPEGWLGKHWACQQLAAQAGGEILLFSDADTVYHPLSLQNIASAIMAYKADMLAVIPLEQVVTPAEKLVVPFFLWGVLAFLPLWLAYRVSWPVLSFAIGQCMAFQSDALEAVGGFAAVRDNAVDDMALARRIKAMGLRWRAVDGGQRVQCRMYHNWYEVVQGFSKNTFASFGYNLTVFLLVWYGMAVLFLEPVVVILALGFNRAIHNGPFYFGLVSVLLGLFLWLFFCWRFRFPLYLAFFYPITISLYTLIAIRSMYLVLSDESTWKDRKLGKKRVKII